jgi:hypothetical protein
MIRKSINTLLGLSVVAVMFSTSGCANYVAGRYSMSVDNVVALRSLKGIKINVGDFTDATNNAIMPCNYKGDITTMDGESYAQFIRNALITELKFADIYSESAPVIITGTLNKVDSSTAVATDWTFEMTIGSSSGKSINVVENYNYNGSIVGTASSTCGASASAFVPAVQNLIGKIIKKIPDSLI